MEEEVVVVERREEEGEGSKGGVVLSSCTDLHRVVRITIAARMSPTNTIAIPNHATACIREWGWGVEKERWVSEDSDSECH